MSLPPQYEHWNALHPKGEPLNELQHFPPTTSIDHPSQAKPGIHPFPDRLHVLTMLENPLRWRSRYANFWQFEKMVEESGALLYVAEVALGGRKFEVTDPNNPRHLQLRTSCEFWHKENALNLLTQRLPSDCRYIATLDADVEFVRRDWAQEILHQLQHYDVIQPFYYAQNLGPEDDPPGPPLTSFLYQWTHSGIPPHDPLFIKDLPVHWTTQGVTRSSLDKEAYRVTEAWHPGLAWAYRKSAWDHLGGLMDWLPTGSGDWHMGNALIGQLMYCIDPKHTIGYKRHCQVWQDRAIAIRDNPNGGLGAMPGTLLHRFHGTHKNRQYEHRHKFVINVGFDPDLDLKRDWQGLWQITDRNPKFRDGLRVYARLRNEDER